MATGPVSGGEAARPGAAPSERAPSVLRLEGTRAGAMALCVGIGVFSVQDVVVKELSGGYPVHEAMVIRSLAALPFLLVLVRLAGGFGALRAGRRWPLVLRGVIAMASYTCYYLALPAMSLASATTLWFTAPLFLAALSGLIAREAAPRTAWIAVLVGFAGVLVMVRPGGDLFHWAALLPVVAALLYAVSQLTARRVEATASAPVMSFYQNAVYLVGASILAVALRPLAGSASDPSLAFLLREWSVPDPWDLTLFAICGPIAALATTLLSSAYRTAGSRVAPFEFTALLWAVAWGVAVFGDVPGPSEIIGAAIIVSSGVYAVLQLER